MTDLLSALHTGLDVRDYRVPGRGTLTPRGVMIHHTASSAGSGDLPSLSIVQQGRPWNGPNGETFLPGPLCNILIGRAGTVAVISDGRANHAGEGGWPGLSGSEVIIGIEVENDGIGEPWTIGLLTVTAQVVRALRAAYDIPFEDVIGHKEWAPGRKVDPTFDMDAFRTAVDALLGEEEDMTPAQLAHALGPTVQLGDDGVLRVPLVNDDLRTTTLYSVGEALTFVHQELKMRRIGG